MEGQARRCGISKSVLIKQSINRDFVEVCVCCDIRGYMKRDSQKELAGAYKEGKGGVGNQECYAMQCHAMPCHA